MIARTGTAKPEPRKRSWVRTLLAGVAVVTAVALVLHQVIFAVLLVVGAVIVAALALRARWARYAAGGRIAAWRRRRHQGPASWAELRRHTSRPGDDGIPICTVTRGRTR